MSDIVVEPLDGGDQKYYELLSPERKLVSWVLDKVEPWRDYRDTNFQEAWEEYYRIWRGKWSPQDKGRNSERSKLVSPATAQAVEVATSEIEEAVFGKGKWFDIEDDVADQTPGDHFTVLKLLQEDLKDANVESKMSEIFLLGSIYGTGIGKIVVEKKLKRSIKAVTISDSLTVPEPQEEEEFKVFLVPIPPDKFLIDPFATTIDEALGCAHEDYVPKHTIIQKQEEGIYRPGRLGVANDDIEDHWSKLEYAPQNISDKCKLLEYHGLVPASLLSAVMRLDAGEDEDELKDIEQVNDLEDDTLVEAVITIANDHVLLKATPNKFIMKDRGFIAYQHDTVPNRFWGRGIVEKGYNAQKALDAELRARIDGMALTIHPMMGVDATRLVKGTSLTVSPGKSILTSGPPKDILLPINFGNVSPVSFTQGAEFERMIQMATGAMDSAAPVGVNPRNSTASGMSMILSGAIKRSKRTLSNIENNFIIPLLNKFLWRYQQFDSERYPVQDTKFKMMSSLGIMARELEQAQLSNMLKTVPPDSPAYWMLIRNMYKLSSLDDKEEMIAISEQMLQSTMQPNPMQQQAAQLELMKLQKEVEEIDSKIMLNMAKAKESLTPEAVEDTSNQAALEAQLKLKIAEMDNQTKLLIAQMDAQNDLKIAEIQAKNKPKTTENN